MEDAVLDNAYKKLSNIEPSNDLEEVRNENQPSGSSIPQRAARTILVSNLLRWPGWSDIVAHWRVLLRQLGM